MITGLGRRACCAMLLAAGVAVLAAAAGRPCDREPAPLLARRWAEFAAGRPGRVIFARPPHMLLLDLSSGGERQIPGVTVAGGPGRRLRGATPRPSWAPDGNRFCYRYDRRVYVCDLEGRKRPVLNPNMDCSDETRWSWARRGDDDWLAGPGCNGDVILVSVADPRNWLTAHGAGDVDKFCEVTGDGRFVVYDNGSQVRVAPFAGRRPGLAISRGQSCRPSASPTDRVAWLAAAHDRYRIHAAADGRFLGDLLAPPGEEIYRLSWSNLPGFVAHMFGSKGNTRMHVREVGSGAALFIGCGWDPDLWLGAPPAP